VKFKTASLIMLLLPAFMAAQGLEPSEILHPLPGSWPTYNGDYSGKRFSALKLNPRHSK